MDAFVDFLIFLGGIFFFLTFTGFWEVLYSIIEEISKPNGPPPDRKSKSNLPQVD